jgi:hypothetical protein
MPTWSKEELERIARAEEVDITPRRSDGAPGKAVPVWIVRAGDDLYVRSAVRGRNAVWYRAAKETHEGRLSGGRVEKDVRFEEVDPSAGAEIDAAYRAKYRRYAGPILNSCLTSEARSTTLRVVPVQAPGQVSGRT